MKTQYKHEPRAVPLIPQESVQQQQDADRIADLEDKLKKISRSVRKLESTVEALAGAVNRINLSK